MHNFEWDIKSWKGDKRVFFCVVFPDGRVNTKPDYGIQLTFNALDPRKSKTPTTINYVSSLYNL